MFKLNNLNAPSGSHHGKKRKGRGMGSGLGKTAGRGHKGQKSRSGGRKVHPTFEGGQMSIARKAPKVGFVGRSLKHKKAVNISDLGKYEARDLELKDLFPSYLKEKTRVKISLMGFRAPKKFPKSIQAHRVAPKTKELLEKAGVKLEILPFLDGHRDLKKKKAKKEAQA